ncbi:MAG: Uma2 family endonuclease [Myxococcales bacterium]|nr:Uma2 family endonuclease [Myxococcales bacterium]
MDQPLRPAKPATYADLAALPDDVKGEIIDGVLYTQPRPRAIHANIDCCVVEDLRSPFQWRRNGGPGGWWILPEPGIQVPRAPEFSPDAAGWRWEHLPRLPAEGTIRTIPDWICEVLSPSNRRYDLEVKRKFYAELGVDHLWYIDPPARSLTVSRLRDGDWALVGVFVGDARVRAAPFDALEIDMAHWWSTDPPQPSDS